MVIRRHIWTLALAGAVALGLFVLFKGDAPRVKATTTERVVSDWRSGVALQGYDPVAYFVNARAVPGRPEHEAIVAGVTWRFRNQGNQGAFADSPAVYMPRFGGYDPIAVARGVARPGHPEIWMIERGKLYLFYDAESRAAFAAKSAEMLGAADAKWPDVLKLLTP